MTPTNRYSTERIAEPQTLLVVEDDPLIRSLEAEFLSSQGYKVLQAESSAEALRLAATATIHLLLTEFAMPEVDGLELTRRFRTVHPEAPVLLVSGRLPEIYNQIGDVERFDLLPKPFELRELHHKVRKLLDAAAPLPIRKP